MSAIISQERDQLDRYVENFGKDDRAMAVHSALCDLRRRSDDIWTVMAELLSEVHEAAHWKWVWRDDGDPYANEDDYFKTVLGLNRTSAKNLVRLGTVIRGTPRAWRTHLRASLADLGISKAVVLAPALERAKIQANAQIWLDRAQKHSGEELRRSVAISMQLKKRGVQKPLTRLLSHLRALGVAEDVIRDLFAVGTEHCGETDATAIVTCAFRDAIALWRS